MRALPGFGATYAPPGDGPFPTVMLLHGSEGAYAGWSHMTATTFAAHGFLALPFGYSRDGNAWNAGSILDIPLDRTAEALVALRGSPRCNGRVGLYGVSRGGEHALLVTALMARDGVDGLPDAVAVHSAADVICGAFHATFMRDQGDPGWRVWDPAERAWTWRGSSDTLLPSTAIEIEHYAGPLFLSHGTIDQAWSVEMARRLEVRLRAHGRSPEVHLYEGQDHGFDDEHQNRHTALLLDFFDRHLGQRRPPTGV